MDRLGIDQDPMSNFNHFVDMRHPYVIMLFSGTESFR